MMAHRLHRQKFRLPRLRQVRRPITQSRALVRMENLGLFSVRASFLHHRLHLIRHLCRAAMIMVQISQCPPPLRRVTRNLPHRVVLNPPPLILNRGHSLRHRLHLVLHLCRAAVIMIQISQCRQVTGNLPHRVFLNPLPLVLSRLHF